MKGLSIGGALMVLAAATCAHAQSPGGDSITADIVMNEIRDIGWAATDYEDSAGNPRIATQVDQHNWAIVLHDCSPGVLEQRQCRWFEFIVDTQMPSPVPTELINKWNKEYRYARASLQQGNQVGCPGQGNCTARIATDVLVTGTRGDPARTFRGYFDVIRRRSSGFRHYIGAPD
jgi:hypothetical protein